MGSQLGNSEVRSQRGESCGARARPRRVGQHGEMRRSPLDLAEPYMAALDNEPAEPPHSGAVIACGLLLQDQ